MTPQAKTSKTTFRISPEALDSFQHYIDVLGLRRDKYLNRVLPIALELLSSAKANSIAGQRFLKSMRDVRSGSLKKVAVALETDLLKELNAVCSDKRLPRDYFFQAFLESLVQVPDNGSGPAPLPSAASLIENPWEQWAAYSEGETPFDHIILEDFDETDLEEAVQMVAAQRGTKGS